MDVLFYGGLVMVFATFVPLLMVNGKLARDKRQYENMPLKMDELRATYRKRRFMICIVQLAGLAIAAVGVLL